MERKLRIALDESRLLILGAQVLFGFQFQGVFQEEFAVVPADSRMLQCAGLLLLTASVGLFITPSLFHQIACRGETRTVALKAAIQFAGLSLLPLTLGLGLSAFVVFEHVFNRTTGIIAGSTLTLVALALLYGWGFIIKARRTGETMPQEDAETPLKTKIEQMLTEARVIIPGAQALLGFQFVATLTKSFSELPVAVKWIHMAGLCAVALSATMLMTTAALHRIGFGGEDDQAFFRIGSRLVIAASLPLALGIAAEVYVVFFKVAENGNIAALAGIGALATLLLLWFVFPVLHAMRSSA